MKTLLVLITLIKGQEVPQYHKIDYCKLPVDKFHYSKQIELGIGCSYIGSQRVYSQSHIKDIYESR